MNFDPNTGEPINNNQQPFQPVPPQPLQPEKKNTIALVAMCFSIVGFNIISLILGFIGLSKVKKTNDGLVFSIVAIVLSTLETIGIIFVLYMAIINYPSLKQEADQITSRCSVAYDCELKTKSEYNCKYRDSNDIEQQTVCPFNMLHEGQYKTVNNRSSFKMTIEDTFTISGRGTVVTGKIESGSIKTNDYVQISGLDKKPIIAKVGGIESFRKTIDSASEGETVGILLVDISADQVQQGQVLTSTYSITTKTTTTSTTTKVNNDIKSVVDFESLSKLSDSAQLHDYNGRYKPIDFELDDRCKKVGDKVSFEKDGIKIEYTCDEHDDDENVGGWNASVLIDGKIKYKEIGITTCTHTFMFKIGQFYIEHSGSCAVNTSRISIYNLDGVLLNEYKYLAEWVNKDETHKESYSLPAFVNNNRLYYAVIEEGFTSDYAKRTVYLYSLDLTNGSNKPVLIDKFDGYVIDGN